MEANGTKKYFPFAAALIIGLLAFGTFLVETKFATNPLVLFIVGIFLLMPYRKESQLVRRVMLLLVLSFAGWIITFMGYSLIPFIVAFMLAYLFDPLVTLLAKKKVPRWLIALFIVLFFIGIVTAVAVYIFPSAFAQLDNAIKTVSGFVKSISSYLESRKFYRLLAKFGIKEDIVKDVVQTEIAPTLEGFLSNILKGLLTILTSVSLVATQIINAILVPILLFYLLKDFPSLRNYIKSILQQKNEKMIHDIRRINKIIRIYITWQITAALIVGTLCSISFSIFNVPYPIVLGVICGLLNPIPYLGSFASIIICCVTVIFTGPENLTYYIIVILATILTIHFINAYLLEPNIAGRQVGLHPVVVIASLFVFGGLFGFLGLLIAVPTTAALMMFFNDWRANVIVPGRLDIVESEET